MDMNTKKITPKDVFITTLEFSEQKWRVEGDTVVKTQKNKPSGNESVDKLADIISLNMMKRLNFYEKAMGTKPRVLNGFMMMCSGMSLKDWLNQYILLAAKELLLETDYNLREVGKRLCFSGENTFGRWFLRIEGELASDWRSRAKYRRKKEDAKEVEEALRLYRREKNS